jgi:hypothetical protein
MNFDARRIRRDRNSRAEVMSTPSTDQRDRVRPNWLAFACVAAAGVALGAAPYLLFMRVEYLAAPLFAYAAFMLAWRVRRYECQATEHPDPLEWLLAGWTAAGVGAVASAIGFAWYWGVYGLAWLAGAAIRALGWDLTPDPSELGTYFSATFFAIFAAALPFVLADELPAKLYPRIAGTRSAYFALANRRWLIAALAAAGVAALTTAILLGIDLRGFWFTLLAALAFLFTGTPLFSVGEATPTSRGDAQVINAVKELFTAAGYALTERPSTGDPEVDPLIAVVDILARAPSRSYAVKLTMLAGAEAQLNWSEAVELRTAAKTIQRLLRAGDAPESIVEPYLLVVGGKIGEELRVLAVEEDVRLVHFTEGGALRKASATDALPAERRARALELLRLEAAEPTADSPGGVATT